MHNMLTGQIVRESDLCPFLSWEPTSSPPSQSSLVLPLTSRVGKPCPRSLLPRTRMQGSEAKRGRGVGRRVSVLFFPT